MNILKPHNSSYFRKKILYKKFIYVKYFKRIHRLPNNWDYGRNTKRPSLLSSKIANNIYIHFVNIILSKKFYKIKPLLLTSPLIRGGMHIEIRYNSEYLFIDINNNGLIEYSNDLDLYKRLDLYFLLKKIDKFLR